ncbi:acetyl-CoA carboxylase biotin carboxylase subunit [Jeotgalibacillus soli]|uniref:biotin carboxylase n=1 Tax=Jeotgalibacillus soli TaxID=889306 RepID=A0A0C2VJX2_9BACL|nr:biotin carboxylase N-terminal domain-containing protein [Jeotgalibacillus soli]KIL44781.1 biotin carboxylase [Jeotgalibacillus soli]
MKKLLVANRGEIALRIIRSCQKLNITTVAIYSEADAQMPYVSEADIAYEIGPAPVAKSYLNMDAILNIAKKEQVDAIHPGYGLLSENAIFVRKIEDAGIRFVGPDASIIERMGDKISARKTMMEAGVAVIPGIDSEMESVKTAFQFATEVGYPIMLKASSGGGGVGMIRCDDEQALTQHFESTKQRSKTYFGSDRLFIEKYIPRARHIEVQIFGDYKGSIFHLWERNCSMQRRNQKIVEESPAPKLSNEARTKILKTAVRAAQAVGYKNAGTIEMIVDEKENAYFLEMNTRLQVEHPVSEMITGVDLVEWQLLTAMEKPLPISKQQEIHVNGHAMEFRLYAEDPITFYPSPGTLSSVVFPSGEGIRIDEGYLEGNKVTPFYDPMIAKMIIHADSREKCLEKARKAVKATVIEGVKTNLLFFIKMLDEKDFIEGSYHTQSIDQIVKGEKNL